MLSNSAAHPFRFILPAFGGLLYGFDIGATSCATISIQVVVLLFFLSSLLFSFFLHLTHHRHSFILHPSLTIYCDTLIRLTLAIQEKYWTHSHISELYKLQFVKNIIPACLWFLINFSFLILLIPVK